MGRNLSVGLLVIVALVGLVGCAPFRAPVVPPQGLVFSNTSAPLSTEFNQSTPASSRQGTASANSVLGLVAWGDASANTAAANGGLTTINYADYKVLTILFGVYSQFTVVAHGN